MKGFVPLREEAEKRGKLIKAASDRHAPPDEACKLIGSFGQAEVKMIKYVESQFGEMRNSAADRRAAQDRPQEHRDDAKKVCAVAQQAADARTGRPEPERSAGLFGRAAGGDADQEGRQHLRYAERQRSHAMTCSTMSDATARVADATGNWVDTRAPPWSRPYLRLSRFDRPIGSWLLLMPCWWSAALAAGVAHDIRQLPLVIVLFFVGAFVMRGAGCTWNDITDRDLDARVERTRSRPIPAGQVSVTQAVGLSGACRR